MPPNVGLLSYIRGRFVYCPLFTVLYKIPAGRLVMCWFYCYGACIYLKGILRPEHKNYAIDKLMVVEIGSYTGMAITSQFRYAEILQSTPYEKCHRRKPRGKKRKLSITKAKPPESWKADRRLWC